MWLSESQKFGVAFTFGGVLFFILGIFTFFDRALLALGNILFLLGVLLIIGPNKTLYFFSKPKKRRGSICFAFGIILILMKYSFTGFMIESVGIVNLFGDFFGPIVSFLRSLPLIGPILRNPVIAPVVDKLAGITVLPV
ncbi:hypothetical protein TBLA_0B04700 [Henningerozyma blattae CBS 6284]|uniref:Golgi transport n=1 Tax=Henningerozyma blattae (strain ATCC 34711 / CBS 6284 / DSM 70876 / NBRC 10599 / NRRL Y-10934 / UCD 77-7) TaxID=1071380 RepID=I2GYV4_HENB6|nr:hypothetical protein TBLA_0B04700 [Tetrapisispora blattae CBS 6284]CCH59306.1 hypothetical protein TBLA_0B04700 [Tetrapisispora blattae CBS 6284]